MDTGVIIAIIVGALVLIAAIAIASKMARERRLDGKRNEAREIRHEAQVRGAQGERQQAEAEERSARARKEQAIADEQAAEADKHQRFARERHAEAQDLDPDSDAEQEAREEHTQRERR